MTFLILMKSLTGNYVDTTNRLGGRKVGNRNSKRLGSVNAIAPLLLQSTEGYLKKPQVEFAHKVTFSVSTVLR